ncbi:MAG: AMP-binding protein [Desulfuromonadaceae bacterium]
MDRPNAALELLRHSLQRHPDKTAYICGEDKISYRELDAAGKGFAALLMREGIAAGDRVVLALPDCIAFPVALLGCLLTGAVAVMAGTEQTPENLQHILADSQARLLVRTEAAEMVGGDAVRPLLCDRRGPLTPVPSDEFNSPFRPSEDAFAFMLYSSGSTGRLKGIPHRHNSLLLPCQLVGEQVFGLRNDDLIFSTSKLSFGYGLINSFSFPLWFGATALLHADRTEIGAVLELIERHRPSVFFSVPTVYAQMILAWSEPAPQLPLRLCCSAGEALPALLFEEWRYLTGLEILDGIGASELSHHFISNRPGQALAGSVGCVVPGYRVKLVDADGREVPEGEEGDLLVSGGTQAPCYWNLPELTCRTMLPNGFIRTGDIFLQRNGHYYYRGRRDDMIKVDARWVAPAQVEAVLLEHPAVAECAVAAVTVGPLVRPGAFLVLVPGWTWSPALVRELRDRFRSRLPEYMHPARFRVLGRLPRTATGKIQRYRLRQLT